MSNQLPGRTPPNNIESEQAVLGCILLDPQQALPVAVEAFGGLEVFYDLRHQVIFDACVAITDANMPLNTITLMERLLRTKQLEQVGGIPYLSALPDATPTAAEIEYFAGIVEEKASLRRMITACTAAITNIHNGENSAEELIANAERDVMAVRRQRKDKTPAVKELVAAGLEEIERLWNSQGAIGGLTTGFLELDRATDGLHGGEMIVVAAFPGAGKTALAMSISEVLAVVGNIPVGVFSLEMSAKRLIMRMLSSGSRVNMRRIRDGFMQERDFPRLKAAAINLSKSPIHFCDLSDLTIAQLRAKARQMIQKHGVRMIVVDYLQLLSGQTAKSGQSREQEVSGISRGIKQMACEFNVPVLALSQLNEDGKLRESRAIGQDADSVWALKLKDENATSDEVLIELEIRKQRDGQAPAKIDLLFLKAFTRFESAPILRPGD